MLPPKTTLEIPYDLVSYSESYGQQMQPGGKTKVPICFSVQEATQCLATYRHNHLVQFAHISHESGFQKNVIVGYSARVMKFTRGGTGLVRRNILIGVQQHTVSHSPSQLFSLCGTELD